MVNEATQPFGILTIGYGNRSLDDFVALLCSLGVEYLIDIRSVPHSQHRPEFSGGSLRETLRSSGIRYVFMGDCLGGRPDDPDCYVNGKVDYLRCRNRDWFRAGLKRLETAWASTQHVVLMCSEGKPEKCHRSKLIGEELTALRIPVLHVDESGALVPHPTVMDRLDDGQLTLFESPESATMSRKRYAPRRQDGGSGG